MWEGRDGKVLGSATSLTASRTTKRGDENYLPNYAPALRNMVSLPPTMRPRRDGDAGVSVRQTGPGSTRQIQTWRPTLLVAPAPEAADRPHPPSPPLLPSPPHHHHPPPSRRRHKQTGRSRLPRPAAERRRTNATRVMTWLCLGWSVVKSSSVADIHSEYGCWSWPNQNLLCSVMVGGKREGHHETCVLRWAVVTRWRVLSERTGKRDERERERSS